jgi:diguanylate cyclase (GGDEF)-like protein
MPEPEAFSILLVDDDLTVVRILHRILSGFAPIRFANSGRMALKLARESVPDLVLLDVDMPEVSGFEVCTKFKSEPALAQVPIIFITSHESSQLEAKGIELGAADFINKPPHAPLVLARVRTYQRLKMLSDTVRSAVKMDFLTGTVTRREFEKILTLEWLRAQRSAAPLALLVADIDGFTVYNGEFGEEKGDTCLKSVADALRSAARRPTDVLGRHAGGKFALLLPESDARAASIIARRAIDAVDALQILHATSTIRGRRISLSVGGGYHHSSRTAPRATAANAVPNDLIAAAERAVTIAKSSGGHQARFIDITHIDSAHTALRGTNP